MPNQVIINLYGTKHWYNEDSKLHREDGPAVISKDGNQYWYRNGKCHREDGPAVIYKDGNQEWYLNGKEYTEDAYITIQFFNGVKLNG
jgi:uncharacterized protein (UPF0216 family)